MDTLTRDDIDLTYVDVIFEITRFCNMECPHCIRGERQHTRIKKDYINSTLQQIPAIGTLTFSGGEPALAIDLMNYTLEACRHYNTDILNFWMATNGSIATGKFFDCLTDWLEYCSDNEISGLRVSLDNYHDDVSNNIEKFEEFHEYNELNFYLELQGAPNDSSLLIADGRAYYNFPATRQVEHSLHLLDDGRIEGSLYINAKGYVLSTCDISYETSDAKGSEYVICHCTEDIQQKLFEFFQKHPELVYD